MQFRDAAIESAERYSLHLEKEGGALIKTGVAQIEKKDGGFWLHLKDRLQFPNDCSIRIHNIDYTHEQIEPTTYDEERRTLRVYPHPEYHDVLASCSLQDIFVVSNLQFLVERVKEWYENHENQLRLPSCKPNVVRHALPSLQDQPSDEQNTAIEGVLLSPFSYVWGAPGTGKTKFVLARCILTYILAGKKVLITAPTNNAVEQMLYGILPVLKEAGVEFDHVLRLGIASQEFINKYPSVCESKAHENYISSLMVQIQADKEKLKETDKDLARLPGVSQFRAKFLRFQECASRLLPLFHELDSLRSQEKSLRTADVLIAKRRLLEEEQKKLHAECERNDSLIHELNLAAKKYDQGLRKRIFKKRYERHLESLRHATDADARIQNQLKALSQKMKVLEKEEQQHDDSVRLKHGEIRQCENQIKMLTELWEDLSKAALNAMSRENMSAEYPKINELLEKLEEKFRHNEPIYQSLENISEQGLLLRREQLTQELAEHQKELQAAKKQGASACIKKATVLAATIDRCIKDIPPNGDFIPEHVFLDEAGYCSLIKAVTLTAYRCPLTFLGDHMQLPPVCEMKDRDMINEDRIVALWAQSALYAEDALEKTPEQVCENYLHRAPARFQRMKKFNLTHTYRFGKTLAQVLESEIYTEGFTGNPNNDTEIFYLPVHKIPGEKKRTNPGECQAIREYCQSTNECSIGIISPYTHQRAALQEALSFFSALSDAVMTVHGSQGREWDVVLFSVVDTADKFFTNSRCKKSNGKQVINTAVSRAKKKLILVCDADYWQTQNQQLIGKLLGVAQKIEIPPRNEIAQIHPL